MPIATSMPYLTPPGEVVGLAGGGLKNSGRNRSGIVVESPLWTTVSGAMPWVSRLASGVTPPTGATKTVSPSAVTVRDCLPFFVPSTVPKKTASPSPASTETSFPRTTFASMATPERPRTASRSDSGVPSTAEMICPVNAESPSKRIESIPVVVRSPGAVPEVKTKPAHPALPGLLTATVSSADNVKCCAPQNSGSPDTWTDVPSWRK